MASMSATNGNASPAANSGGSKAQLKTTTSGKAMDGTRKQAASPIDASQSNFVGLTATVTLKSGERFSGIFSSSSLEQQESRYTFKMVKRLPSLGGQVNGTSESYDEYCGVGRDHRMTFDVKDVVVLNVDNVSMDKTKTRNGASIGFKTDSDISGNLQARERDLQRWVPSAETEVDLSLADDGTGWDQFETNERLFGATSNYDEDLYTTKIDRSDPRYKDRAAKAEKLAREIESGAAMNSHVLEERGHAAPDDSGLDEEEKYSGVRRDLPSGQPNKYTPPARRAPTGQATVPDSFKQFSANEKMKLQERQRHAARHDKNVKLNDLKKFAMNFNYSAPIPDDLIPILAKDPSKQQEIKQKSQQAAETRKTSAVSATEAKAATNAVDAKTQQRASGPAVAAPASQRGRPGQGPFPQAPRGDRDAQNIPGMPPRNGPGMLSQRLAITQQQHKAGAGMPNVPMPIHDLRIPPSGPAAPSSGSHTPSSSLSTRFNVKAIEFRPNPAANTFTPGGNSSNASSPRKESVPPRPEPRRVPTSSFFGAQKPALPSEKASLSDLFNPIKRMKKDVQAENKAKEYSANGGIPQAYRTPPTWDVPEQNLLSISVFCSPISSCCLDSWPKVL
ncbi:putative pab1 binding protein [Neofusicoccum parvum UCRNP2]|uniref:Putative pab1 binding protein n=1 Tax=Botryosphaeria parva (strain UCR-NP2) TaxID=1287680 RepID=R1EIC9_BOTPV|nr:putative pab1 binding protein [Neofusicoccum parvum UCRNP2]